jgi:hypothetical protein
MKRIATVILLLSAALYGQEKIKPLTAEEELDIRTPQIRSMQDAAQKAAITAQYQAEMEKDPKYVALDKDQQEADAEAQKALDEVYSSRRLNKNEVVFCMGQTHNAGGVIGGPCDSAPANRLSLQPLTKVKSDNKASEVKKP